MKVCGKYNSSTILTVLTLFLSLPLLSQDKNLIQYTGRVFNEFIQPLSFAHVRVVNKNLGTITDREGKFSFVVQPHDTIEFSSLGYKHAIVIIPDTLETKFYTRDVLMASDTFMIEEVEVYPWANYDEFTEAFVNLELPEDDLDRARRNIAMIKEQLKTNDDPLPSANFNQTMQQNTWKSFNRGTYPTYQIFNILAWQKFIQALKNGDLKNKDD